MSKERNIWYRDLKKRQKERNIWYRDLKKRQKERKNWPRTNLGKKRERGSISTHIQSKGLEKTRLKGYTFFH